MTRPDDVPPPAADAPLLPSAGSPPPPPPPLPPLPPLPSVEASVPSPPSAPDTAPAPSSPGAAPVSQPAAPVGAATAAADPVSGHPFAPLRSEPPPRLFATWWLRYVLALSQLVGIAVVLLREYDTPGGMDASFVVIPHVMAAVMLVGWSALAMIDAARLVPATRYRQPSRASVAVVLWAGAFTAPVAAIAVIRWVQDRFADDTDDLLPMLIGTSAVLVSFVLVWMPFRYHVRQADRIGAPVGVVAAWFWVPLLAVVGVFAAMALGLNDLLADGGFTDLERTVRIAVLYGVPALVFTMSTWRATTVFDEVIELRWLRWRTEWEYTLTAFAAQPPPGPEASPVISGP